MGEVFLMRNRSIDRFRPATSVKCSPRPLRERARGPERELKGIGATQAEASVVVLGEKDRLGDGLITILLRAALHHAATQMRMPNLAASI
jgi:hypothetical protein